MQMLKRCAWCGTEPVYQAYHDQEWGVPLHDEQQLFEFLILEGMQAGLSWWCVLQKRARFREVFDDFDPLKIARYDAEKQQALLNDPGIIRNRLKISATINNANRFLALKDQGINFSDYLWQFVDHQPIQHHYEKAEQIPTTTVEAEAMSKALKKAGFKFIGATICYAFMQATGMVNDHLQSCFRSQELSANSAD